MINVNNQHKVKAKDILSFLNYKKEITANMLKYNGPSMPLPQVDRIKLILYIYDDLCNVVNSPENLNEILKEIKYYEQRNTK